MNFLGISVIHIQSSMQKFDEEFDDEIFNCCF